MLHIETQNGKRLPHAGRIIALVGADGAGKTTLVSEIEKWLRGRIDVTTVYLGSGEGSQGFGPLFRRSMARLVGAYRKRYPRPNTLPESDDRSVTATDIDRHRTHEHRLFDPCTVCRGWYTIGPFVAIHIG